MSKRMLIDASHAEETRVVVLDGTRLDDFDIETEARRHLKGNIYLAKVVRVEPSLQAAFVEFGGNRHGFLAFGEIHPDYYQIPVADRQRLLAMQEEEARAEQEREERADALEAGGTQPLVAAVEIALGAPPAPDEADSGTAAEETAEPGAPESLGLGPDTAPEMAEPAPSGAVSADETAAGIEARDEQPQHQHANGLDGSADLAGSRVEEVAGEPAPPPETIGGETDTEEPRERRQPSRYLRNYKIQEVIRRRQILLVQVVKEERGTKGAALTTYISLAGRYSVLMPNSPRGGGVSRKITSAADRKRLKEVTSELELPRGMALIIRTAGANRPKPEIRRDCEYLLRLWDDIREHTLRSVAPALIYEEASLIKRAIRDVYSGDIDEILVDGEDGWRAARDFMRALMPTHVKKVQLWRDGGMPLFAKSQVEAQIDQIFSPVVQLRSGGYLVINQTEALVAIDVNSGRSTRERGIEDTAYRTNLEAAEEVARQLRLRDLAGLVVIDFIDMESRKHVAAVERRLKDALKADRARIQVGHISHFGLLEMSRQRLRPSLAETSLSPCPHCAGTGHVRSPESAALHVLRQIEEEGGRRRAAEICVHLAPAAALYLLNNKRARLADMETRYGMTICFAADASLQPGEVRIDRLRAQTAPEAAAPVIPALPPPMDEIEDVAEESMTAAGPHLPAAGPTPETAEARTEEEARRRRRRRRGRGTGRRDPDAAPMPEGAEQPDIGAPVAADSGQAPSKAPDAPEPSQAPREETALDAAGEAPPPATPKPRSRRGGRGRTRKGEEAPQDEAAPAPAPAPYQGPTPADPFAVGVDVFDIFERAEAAAAPKARGTQADSPSPRAEAPATLAVAPEPEPEPEPGAPRIRPVVIGATAEPPEKRRGWWRR